MLNLKKLTTMDLKQEYEARIKKLEGFIETKGFGSKQLKKARKVQRTVNISVFLGSLITLAGLTIWALNKE